MIWNLWWVWILNIFGPDWQLKKIMTCNVKKKCNSFFSFPDQRHGNSTVFDHPIIGFDDPQNGRNNKPLEKETNLSTQEQKGPVSSNSEISSSSSNSSNNQKSKQEEQTKLTQKVPHAPQQFHKRLEITWRNKKKKDDQTNTKFLSLLTFSCEKKIF